MAKGSHPSTCARRYKLTLATRSGRSPRASTVSFARSTASEIHEKDATISAALELANDAIARARVALAPLQRDDGSGELREQAMGLTTRCCAKQLRRNGGLRSPLRCAAPVCVCARSDLEAGAKQGSDSVAGQTAVFVSRVKHAEQAVDKAVAAVEAWRRVRRLRTKAKLKSRQTSTGVGRVAARLARLQER